MSYVIAAPEMMTAVATDLAGIGSYLGEANTAAAASTTRLITAAEDEVSAAIAKLFVAYGREYQAVAGLAAACVPLTGCELLGFFAGHGSQKALFDLPKDKRVLVLVDVRPEVTVPPTFAITLGDRISSYLFRNKATDKLVGQDRLLDLRRDDARFRKMGVADIAATVDADVVIVAYVVSLDVGTSTDGTVTQGAALVTVKVVDRSGDRLWPGDAAGTRVEARVDPAFASDRDKAQVYKELGDLLTVRVGRMFHKYSLEDRDATR